jgi:hypothetical protein
MNSVRHPVGGVTNEKEQFINNLLLKHNIMSRTISLCSKLKTFPIYDSIGILHCKHFLSEFPNCNTRHLMLRKYMNDRKDDTHVIGKFVNNTKGIFFI